MPQNAAINSRFLTQKNTGQVVSSLHMLPPRILVFSYTTAAEHNTVQQARQNTFTRSCKPILNKRIKILGKGLKIAIENCDVLNSLQKMINFSFLILP